MGYIFLFIVQKCMFNNLIVNDAVRFKNVQFTFCEGREGKGRGRVNAPRI